MTLFLRIKAGAATGLAGRCAALCAALGAVLGAVLAPAPAPAAQSAAVAITGGDVRLIAGPTRDGVVEAGIEIRLGPGWKTYWRYPGDSGVPPHLDFANSVNVAGMEVDFPAPRRFSDGAGGYSIGYKGTVLLPLKVRLADPAKPARLDVALDFAVCEALCTLARAELLLVVNTPPADDDAARADAARDDEQAATRIAAARALVPQPAPLGAPDGPALLSATLDRSTQPARLVLEARAASPKADLFAEGPDSGWALPLPQKTALPDGKARFVLPLDGLPPDARPEGSTFTLTLVDPPRAVTTKVEIRPSEAAKP